MRCIHKNMHWKKRLPFTTFFRSARAAFIGRHPWNHGLLLLLVWRISDENNYGVSSPADAPVRYGVVVFVLIVVINVIFILIVVLYVVFVLIVVAVSGFRFWRAGIKVFRSRFSVFCHTRDNSRDLLRKSSYRWILHFALDVLSEIKLHSAFSRRKPR